MALEEMPAGAVPVEPADEPWRSPVEVAVSIRKELAEFQRTGNSQALREKAREELRAASIDALRRAAAGDGPDYLNIEPIVEYLEQRGLIKSNSRRTKRAIETASRSN